MAEQHRAPNDFLRERNRKPLETWAIYQRPPDFPDKFVVRRFLIIHGQEEPAPELHCQTADTLEAARQLIPEIGFLWRVERQPEDVASLVEVWV